VAEHEQPTAFGDGRGGAGQHRQEGGAWQVQVEHERQVEVLGSEIGRCGVSDLPVHVDSESLRAGFAALEPYGREVQRADLPAPAGEPQRHPPFPRGEIKRTARRELAQNGGGESVRLVGPLLCGGVARVPLLSVHRGSPSVRAAPSRG
jgi:hypothetical protein